MPRECRAGHAARTSLRATRESLRNVDRWAASHADGRRIVAITLRNYAYMPARNSNMEAWTAFARRLDPTRFMPVFVPDLEQTLNGQLQALQGHAVLGEAAWNLGLRMALYERSYISLGREHRPHGPVLAQCTHPLRHAQDGPENVPQTSRAFYLELGFEPGRSLPFAAPTQELVWEDDTSRHPTRIRPHRRAPRERSAGPRMHESSRTRRVAGQRSNYVLIGRPRPPFRLTSIPAERQCVHDRSVRTADEGTCATDHPAVGRGVRQQAGDDDAAGAADARQSAGAWPACSTSSWCW